MKLNLKLLKKIFLAERPPGKEQETISLILNYCKNIQNLTYKLDSENNLFITKNTNNQKHVSCIIAHMDSIITHKGERLISIRNNEIKGFQKIDHTQCSLGADDGIGICIALQLLNKLEDIKVIFTTKEEAGGIGAYTACYNIDFFKNVNFFIQADRKGNSDLITNTNGIKSGSIDFVSDISDLSEKYGYKENTGTFTDVGIFAEEFQLSGVNVSCGYRNEHTKSEYTVISDAENCLNYIHDILVKLNNHNPYKIETLRCNWMYYNINFYKEIQHACNTCTDFDCLNCKWYNML